MYCIKADSHKLYYSVSDFFFNGISIFVGHLIPKPSLWKSSTCTIYLTAGGIRGFMPFLRVFFLSSNLLFTMLQYSTLVTMLKRFLLSNWTGNCFILKLRAF